MKERYYRLSSEDNLLSVGTAQFRFLIYSEPSRAMNLRSSTLVGMVLNQGNLSLKMNEVGHSQSQLEHYRILSASSVTISDASC